MCDEHKPDLYNRTHGESDPEFVAHILRRDDRLKVYFGASDLMFPPGNFYGLEETAAEVAAGWRYWVVLHNHTVRTLDGKPALGMPAPSTSDVQLFRGLVQNLGLREVWVTNGSEERTALGASFPIMKARHLGSTALR
jgi:hypothetical protein